MSHRTQVILEDAQYERLLEESARSGRGLGDLVRRAIDVVYLPDSVDVRLEIVDQLAGSLASFDDEDTVVRIASGGLGTGLGDALDRVGLG